MVNFFDNTSLLKELTETRTGSLNGTQTPVVQPKTQGASPEHSDIGLFLSGVKNVNGTNNNSNYLFVTGQGVNTQEAGSYDVLGQTKKLSAFKMAYSNFKSNPTKENAIKLKEAYCGNGNSPIIDNKNVRILYEGQKKKIEELINK